MANPSNLDDVRALLALRKDELLKRYNANGIAVGKSTTNPNQYAIVVYVQSPPDSTKNSIEGVELRLVGAGPFKAL
jgi:hypothetical protein